MTVWTVPATVLRVVDGDTVWLNLDLGWRIYLTAACRIYGINAPELPTPEGKRARDYVAGLLAPGLAVTFRSHQLDKYGRPLGAITWTLAGVEMDLAALMVSERHAVPYFP